MAEYSYRRFRLLVLILTLGTLLVGVASLVYLLLWPG
jgi:hypothetical protein